MQSIYMTNHFNKIYQQREEFANEIQCFKNKEWERPYKDKWSFGETYYHLYLMVRRFRQLNKLYLPLSRPIAAARKKSPYKTHSKDIYTEYKEKHNKPMKAPFILLPSKGIEGKISFERLIKGLDNETKNLEKMLSKIEDDIAGHIRFPDPIAHNPNLIQSIHLIGIHEKQHFFLCKKYYNLN
ncbi:DinB family protein [Bacillus cereus]|uniref:DinB family protein n=1 Tax=Bacillus cereus TaxID=1396 RepID=UPI0020D26664|nr:DinB family protein [Bacillus cereus]